MERERLILPETLFVQHAPVIAEVLEERAARGDLSDDQKKFSARLQSRLGESRTTKLETFTGLGHNPDYLLYGSDTLAELPGADDTDARAGFLWESYASAWKEKPGATSGKIAYQLARSFSLRPRRAVYPRGADQPPNFIRRKYSANTACRTMAAQLHAVMAAPG